MRSITKVVRAAASVLLAGAIGVAVASPASAVAIAGVQGDITFTVNTPYTIDNVLNFGRSVLTAGAYFGQSDPARSLSPSNPSFTDTNETLPLSVFLLGTSTLGDTTPSAADHLILTVGTTYANSAAGKDFSELFPAFSEATLLQTVICKNAGTCSNDGAATSLLFSFQEAVHDAGADVLAFPSPNAPGDFQVLAFSSAQNIGSGTLSFSPSNVTAVPEPAAWAMMIAGVGLVGSMKRRQGARKPGTASLTA